MNSRRSTAHLSPMNLIEADRVKSILDAFHEVYNYFDYGLMESAYAGTLRYALTDRGHQVAREVRADIYFRGHHVARQCLDLLVGQRVIVEIKSTEQIPPNAQRQLLSYLRATPYKVDLLLHFGQRPTFRRFVDSRKRQFEIITSRGDAP